MAIDENFRCEILLESAKAIQHKDDVKYLYFPGESVIGKVVLIIYSSTQFQALDVGIRSEANTEFDKNFGIEEYFMDLLNLAYSIELQPGEYSYPFNFQIPMKFPYSFESKYGSVIFEITVVADLETTNPEVIGELLLCIASNINLNSNPKLKKPVTKEVFTNAKIFRCCCKFGDFSLIITLPCTGYCPTQKIPIIFDCNNKSKVKISGLSVIFEKIVTYKTSRFSKIMKIDKEEIAILKTRGISERENVKFEESLIIPPKTLPSELECGIIEIAYWLKVKINVRGCNTPSPIYLTKIVIGDISINGMGAKLGGGKSYWELDENEALPSKSTLLSRLSIAKSIAMIKQSSFSKSLLSHKTNPSPRKSDDRKRKESGWVYPSLRHEEVYINQPNSPLRQSSSRQNNQQAQIQPQSNQQSKQTTQPSNQQNHASILPLLALPYKLSLSLPRISLSVPPSPIPDPKLSLSDPPPSIPATPLPLPASPLSLTSLTMNQNMQEKPPIHFVTKMLADFLTKLLRSSIMKKDSKLKKQNFF